jgi:serpin B
MFTLALLLGILFPIPIFKVQASSLPQNPELIAQKTSQNNPMQSKLVNAQTQFSFKLFSQVSKDRLSQNLLISPSSVAIALSLLYNGADGKTKQEMSQLLGFQNMTLEEVNLASQGLTKALESNNNGVQLSIANSLWVKQEMAFRHSFLRNNREYFDAKITNLDFRNPQAVGIINRWVSQQTRGKITEIIDRIDPQSILFLINAIYFKGDWQEQFDKNLTRSEDFNLGNGKSKKHPLMAKTGDFLYQETDTFQAVSLPYGNQDWRFDVYLPKENRNLKAMLSQLNQNNWTTWVKNFRRREGLLKLPRFKTAYEIDLDQSLKVLGMASAFNASQANFSQMTSHSVLVDSVKHKTFIDVNEEGTEASAVTSIGIRTTSAMPTNPPFQMIVNRSFFYTIRNEKTGTILFMGTMINPSD